MQALILGVHPMVEGVAGRTFGHRWATRVVATQTVRAPVLAKDEVVAQVAGSRGMIVQVLVNLLLNPMDAVDAAQGVVSVGGDCSADGVRIWVEDDGPGVPVGLRDRVFEPLFTTKPRGQGTGIGLWLSRRLARAHGGDLIVDEAVGGGARFLLCLPRVAVDRSAQAVPAASMD